MFLIVLDNCNRLRKFNIFFDITKFLGFNFHLSHFLQLIVSQSINIDFAIPSKNTIQKIRLHLIAKMQPYLSY